MCIQSMEEDRRWKTTVIRTGRTQLGMVCLTEGLYILELETADHVSAGITRWCRRGSTPFPSVGKGLYGDTLYLV